MLELYHGTTSETAILKWLRPEDIARYDKIADPWVNVNKNLVEEARGQA